MREIPVKLPLDLGDLDYEKIKLIVDKGSIVQISPNIPNKIFAYHFMTVVKVAKWGAEGYINVISQTSRDPCDVAYFRVKWEDLTLIGYARYSLGEAKEEEGE